MDQKPHITKQVRLYLEPGAALFMMLCDARAGQAYPGWATSTIAVDARPQTRTSDPASLAALLLKPSANLGFPGITHREKSKYGQFRVLKTIGCMLSMES